MVIRLPSSLLSADLRKTLGIASHWPKTSQLKTKNRVVVLAQVAAGAWVDGSEWKPVYDILVKDGWHVTLKP
jgi:hypothetical protein